MTKLDEQLARAEVEYQKRLTAEWVSKFNRLDEAIRQVRELHYEYIGECVVCGDGSNSVLYPCPTIKALDGEQK